MSVDQLQKLVRKTEGTREKKIFWQTQQFMLNEEKPIQQSCADVRVRETQFEMKNLS